MRHIRCKLLLAFAFLLFTVPAFGADKGVSLTGLNRVALVVGNSAYKDSPLRNPVNDARLMRDLLTQAGFQVTLLENADKRELVNAIREFGKKLRESDAALFYFSGHGNQFQGRNWLIPVDADIYREDDIEFEALNAERLLREMEGGTEGRVNIVIVDACRSNPTFRSFRSASLGLAEPSRPPEGSLIAFATAPGTVAYDGEGENSPYVAELKEHLLTPGLEIVKVFSRVRAGVKRRTARQKIPQVPWLNFSIDGDFYFVPPIESTEDNSESPPPATATVPAAPSKYNPDEEMWELIRDSNDPEEFEGFIAAYPESKLVPVARVKLKRLKKQQDSTTQTSTVVAASQGAILEVASSPQSDIYLDNRHKGMTPQTLKLQPGTYSLRLSREGYRDYSRQFTLTAGEEKTVFTRLSAKPEAPKTASLRVTSNVPASVFLDGTYRGKTGKRFENISPGNYGLRVSHEGLQDYRTTVKLKAGEDRTVFAKLKPKPPKTASLRVTSNVPASVFLDDVYLGKTGEALEKIKPGSYRLWVSSGKNKPYSRNVTLTAGESKHISVHLSPLESNKMTLYKDANEWKWLRSGDPEKNDVYVGEVQNGIPHGQGVLTDPKGVKYEGEFKDGKPHGKGSITFLDGSKLIMEFKNGDPHGKISGTGPKGQGFIGKLKDGEPWDMLEFDKNGNVVEVWVEGVKSSQKPVVMVFDAETDLLWQKTAAVNRRNWSNANEYCRNLQLGGFTDWILPSKDQLRRIQPKKHRFAGRGLDDYHWSSTPVNYSNAYRVDLYDGTSYSTSKSSVEYVRCVRKASAGAAALHQQPASGTTWTEPLTGMQFVSVPGGSFKIGDQFGEGEDDEKSTRRVSVQPFRMAATEVTVGQFREFVEDSGYKPGSTKSGCQFWNGSEWENSQSKSWDSPGFIQEDDHPVVCVNWRDATAYADWLTKHSGKKFRLPTEAEWEYACREGGQELRFCNGRNVADPSEMNFDGSANFKKSYSIVGTYRNQTTPAGGLLANSLGLFDMSGNVSEWTCSEYNERYDGSEGWCIVPAKYYSFRGGSWYDDANSVRAAKRKGWSPGVNVIYNGFRLVLSSSAIEKNKETVDQHLINQKLEDSENIKINIIQDSENIKIINNTVYLQKKEFDIKFSFRKELHLSVNAWIDKKIFDLVDKKKRSNKVEGLSDEKDPFGNIMAVSVNSSNAMDFDYGGIFVEDDASHYWYYNNKSDHTFNQIRLKDVLVEGVLRIKELDGERVENFPLKKLYLIFLHGDNDYKFIINFIRG